MINIFQELNDLRRNRGINNNLFDAKTFLEKDHRTTFKLIGRDNNQCEVLSKQRAQYDAIQPRDLLLSEEDKIRALCDKIILSIESIELLGFDSNVALLERARELNSRDGHMIDGKFEQFNSSVSKSVWYKADYNKASTKPTTSEVE